MSNKIITDISGLFEESRGFLSVGDESVVPTLASDYILKIYPSKIVSNADDYDVILLQSINFDAIKNGISYKKDVLGYPIAEYNGSNNISFTYFAIPYEYGLNNMLTSVIHYYYGMQLTEEGTLRLRRRGSYNLPKIEIFNLRTNKVVYELFDCTFTYPSYTPNPSSNDIIFYSTTVSFIEYNEMLNDVTPAPNTPSYNDTKAVITKIKKKLKKKVKRESIPKSKGW